MKRILTLLTLLLTVTLAAGQRLTVESFDYDFFDQTASTKRRKDDNGRPCALVKVQLARAGATFDGNIVGDTPYVGSEYLVYMSPGSKLLKVCLADFLPITVNFKEAYGYRDGLKEATTYILTLTLPATAGQPADDGKTYFTLTVEPRTALVYLDGDANPISLDDNGTMMRRLDPGPHSYRVTAGGYETKDEGFELGHERMSRSVRLESLKARLTVECPTEGADIYINETNYGSSTRWPVALDPASYVVEARKDGLRPQKQSIDLSARQERTVRLPALAPIAGQLDVAYSPTDADVWIDGRKRGSSPDVFRDIPVGPHQVEIRKEGYQPETLRVNIEEGKTATLSGSLKAQSSAAGAAAGTAAGAATASAGSSSTGAYSSSATAPGRETFTVGGVRFTMVRVGGGTFTMGATSEQGNDAYDDEKPAHKVTLSSYAIGETEVTQELWEAVMGSNPSYFKGPKRPVECVSWNDCKAFIEKLNTATGRRFRLPTEAEWEFAARGGGRSQGYKYAGSNNLDDVAWYTSNSGSQMHDVAQKRPNELGLYDMSGNVWEWCSDRYGYDYYKNSPQTDPKGPTGGSYRVRRGGGWCYGAGSCRSSYRDNRAPF